MTSSVSGRLAWAIRQNNRYAPLLDTAFKASPIFALVAGAAGLFLWAVFNAYLGQLGQEALPASQAGQWLFLPLFGFLLALLIAAVVLLPAIWTSTVRWVAPSTINGEAIRRSCRATTLFTLPVVALTFFLGDAWTITGLCVAIAVGGMAGTTAITRDVLP